MAGSYVESSESDDVTDVLDFWAVLEVLGVDVDGHELVELDFSVLNVLLEVEGGVDDLELDDVLLLVLVLEWLRDVDDNSPRELLVSVGGEVGDIGLGISFWDLQ